MSLFTFFAFAITGVPELPLADDLDNLTSLVVGAGGDRPQLSIRLLTTGEIQTATGDTGSALSYSTVGYWLDNDSAPIDSSDWQCQLTEDSTGGSDAGTWTGETLGIYHQLNGNVTFTLTKDDNTVGDYIANTTLTVRQISATSNSDSESTSNTVEITL